MSMNCSKYAPATAFAYPQRNWPNKTITSAPQWCSTDLRDGNQALQVPMNLEQKLAFFELLVDIGFKEIEVAFPSASETEYRFVRRLIEENRIPQDVTIEVFTQARDHLIERTFESVRDADKAIIHLYNSTCPLHRDVVFKKSKEEVLNIAVHGARRFKELAEQYGPEKFRFQYSPETFNATEMDYVVELCNAVLDVWQPTPERKVILNLPETVQMDTPNVYADQIEYVASRIKYRDAVIISLHVHNDRGTGIAATELALMAGAQRVEGTIFGNGERTGNVDLVTLALNLYTKGIDPGLDFSNLDTLIEQYETLTGMQVPPRHPYAGELVFTAFSGSHQDAIKKGMDCLPQGYTRWKMPYLIIDPKDLGRNYEAIIRVNSQSGKGGVFYLLKQQYGIEPPRSLQQEFSRLCTHLSDSGQKELSGQELYHTFTQVYANVASPFHLLDYTEKHNGKTAVSVQLTHQGTEHDIMGEGNGLLDAVKDAFCHHFGFSYDIQEYTQQATQLGSQAQAASYIYISGPNNQGCWGVGMHSNVGKSSVLALVSAINRMCAEENRAIPC